MLLVFFRKRRNTVATSLSKILSLRLSPELQEYLQRWRGKESQHSSSVTEHQLLVFPELLSLHPYSLLLSPCVTVTPECSGSLVTVLRCGRPVTAGTILKGQALGSPVTGLTPIAVFQL